MKSSSKNQTLDADTILTTEEAKERFNSVSQFILESQKQHFESLKFSLNMWTIINSGAAIALMNQASGKYTHIIYLFMLGAICSGLGNILLFQFHSNRIPEINACKALQIL